MITMTAALGAMLPTSRVAIIPTAWKLMPHRVDFCLCLAGQGHRPAAVSVDAHLTVTTADDQDAELIRRVIRDEDSGLARLLRGYEASTSAPSHVGEHVGIRSGRRRCR